MAHSAYLVFRLFSLTFKEQGLAWWKDTTHLGQVFYAAQVAGLWGAFRYYGNEDDTRLNKIVSLEALLPETVSWEANSYILTSEEGEEGVSLNLSLRNRTLNILLKVEGQALAEKREVILAQLIKFACQLHSSFESTALLGPDFHVSLIYAAYPRPRPPRQDPQWPIGSVVDFISKSYHTQAGNGDAYQKLLTAVLPQGVVREESGNLIVFHWVKNLMNDTLVAAQRSLQEQWFSKVLDWPIASGYNALGDCLETLWAPQSHPLLTFYIEMYRYGYKATVENPDGSVDDELFAAMASWIAAGALPDGTPLDQLNLILPDRDAALRLRTRAQVIGIKKVLYADNEGSLWNPWPSGLWC